MGIHRIELLVLCRFYNPSDIFSKLGLSRGRNLKFISIRVCMRYRYQVPGTKYRHYWSPSHHQLLSQKELHQQRKQSKDEACYSYIVPCSVD